MDEERPATGGEGEKTGKLKLCSRVAQFNSLFFVRNGVRAETFQEVERPANHLSRPAEA